MEKEKEKESSLSRVLGRALVETTFLSDEWGRVCGEEGGCGCACGCGALGGVVTGGLYRW